jgi:hypothetical protein
MIIFSSYRLTINGIIDISNEGNSSQQTEISDWEDFKKNSSSQLEELPSLHPKAITAIRDITKNVCGCDDMLHKPKDLLTEAVYNYRNPLPFIRDT